MARLPTKPSALLEVAMTDLGKIERSKRYGVHMGFWHTGQEVCEVCLAGAVMAFTLGANHDEYLTAQDFHRFPGCGNQLRALDSFMGGYCRNASEFIGLGFYTGAPFQLEVTPYKDDRRKFKRDMRKLITDMRKAGH